ncbi:MAG: Coenzyme F420 hydrogenase/dehydrogenase, beta subunit C-terminal domain [Deltaproteobacteria bacterium]|nr:Coenzyme F420 hydrogenase/dehydrogenase, beta subunit C-terminal domain [Deltaproteobacteria bacterium]
MQILGPTQLYEDVIAKGLCTGCGACVGLCPYFVTHRAKTSMLFPCDREQGRCFAFCPRVELDLDEVSRFVHGAPYSGEPLGTHRQVLLAQAKGLSGSFQAGGTVSALLCHALQTGAAGAAVVTGQKDGLPDPRVATTAEEVLSASGSKYGAAPVLATVNKAIASGTRDLAVAATPCQAAALAQMGMNPLGREDFMAPASLVIGLFCTWAIDARSLAALAAEHLSGKAATRMDLPPPPSEILVLETGGRRVEVPLSEVRKLVPAGCLCCPDMTAEFADVSVGVVEGEPGWNTLIVRTQKGADLVESAIAAGKLETREPEAEAAAHLSRAAAGKRRRAFARAREQGLLNTAEGRASLRVDEQVAEKILTEES